MLSGYYSRLFRVPHLLPIIIRRKITTPAIWEMSGPERPKPQFEFRAFLLIAYERLKIEQF